MSIVSAGVFGFAVWEIDRAYGQMTTWCTLAIAGVGLWCKSRRDGARPTSAALDSVGSLALATALALIAQVPALLDVRLKAVESASVPFLRGFEAVWSADSGIVVQTDAGARSITATGASLCVPLWLVILALHVAAVGGAVGDAVERWRRVVRATFGISIAALVSFVVRCAVFGGNSPPTPLVGDFREFANPLVVVAAGCPVLWLVGTLLLPEPAYNGAPSRSPRPVSFAAASGVGALVGSAVMLWSAPDVLSMTTIGSRHARIVIDDVHSGFWEGSARPFDASCFGDMALYNYAASARWAAFDHDVRIHQEGPITAEVLRGANVLLVKTPANEIGRGEVAAIRSWVRSGGRLILLGDHTNLFGMNEKLNLLCADDGIRFTSYGVNHYRGGLAPWDDLWYLSRAQWRGVGRTTFMTSCSLKTRGDARRLLVLPQVLCDNPDYAGNSFFGDFIADGDETVGPACVVASVDVGDGRIVAFADSTVFSNFTLCEPGHDRLWAALLLEALAGRAPRKERIVGMGVLLLAACVCGAISMRRGEWSWRATVRGAGLGAIAGVAVAGAIAHRDAEGARACLLTTSAPRAYILEDSGGFALLPAIGSRSPGLEGVSISTFQTALLRGSVFPCFVSGESALPTLGERDAIVIVNPARDWWIGGGFGRALDTTRRREASLAVIARWDSILDPAVLSALDGFLGVAADDLKRRLATPESVVELRGRLGERLLLFALEDVSDAALGHCFSVPSELIAKRIAVVAASLGSHP
jgi:hypothetical protein